MGHNRRKFIKLAGITGASITGSGLLNGLAAEAPGTPELNSHQTINETNMDRNEGATSIIGTYGAWATSLRDPVPAFSFRNAKWQSHTEWQHAARKRLTERMAIPNIGGVPKVTIVKQHTYDGLHIEELTWQLPYGRPTAAVLLKPAGATGKLPGVLAFHDHGGNKYFGCRKIARTSAQQHPMMAEHQKDYYSSKAWANELAKRGYVVLVPDAFTFGSRRVLLQDVPEHLRNGQKDDASESPGYIQAYNEWAGAHEHIMAKSLFSAGTTWPGVFFAEDQKALDVLCARDDVDANRIGCGGLSGGGLRTVVMAGLDPRIACAVDVGFMTTWNDFILHKSFTHTWMAYVPLLPNELEFPEILGLRAPLPTLVLNDIDDTLYTLPEMKRAETILREVFKKANAADRFVCSYHPGPHKFDATMQEEAFRWFDRWLKA
jgi:dienelactone hydrolase